MIKAGILGGGQLGRMLLQKAADFPVETYVMEKNRDCPSVHVCHHFISGDITNYEDVLAFGNMVDVLTIEIENVNLEALEALEAQGKRIVPNVQALKSIKHKILQKELYAASGIPSPAFVVTRSSKDLYSHIQFLPAVHKLDTGGYDGKGVKILETEADLPLGFGQPSVLEKKVDVYKEIALTVAVSRNGKIVLYPPVEMLMNPGLHLLDFQLSPAAISREAHWKAEAIAIQVARAFKSEGLFAVEMFVTEEGEVLVNETAPRVHNSGHHTIEASYCSQFEMLWRILLDLPPGPTENRCPAALVNLIGEPGHSGPVMYEGLEEALSTEQVYVHLYGKKETHPGRKMGHVTITGTDRMELIQKAKKIKQLLKVKTST